MATFKCTMFFQQGTYGWSESYAQNRPDSSYIFAMAALQQLCQYRSALLGQQSSIVGQRVSDFTIRGDGFPKDTLYPGTPYQGQGSDTPFTSLLALMFNGTYSSRKAIYWRGIPDVVVSNGGTYFPDGSPGFTNNVSQLINFLLTASGGITWGWWGRPTPKPLPVQVANYVTTGTLVTVNFLGAIFPAPLVGTRQSVFFSGINSPAKSAINGTQVVTVTSTTSCQLARPISVFPYVAGGLGTWASPVFQAFSNGTAERITERKAGRAFFVERGRQRVRARG